PTFATGVTQERNGIPFRCTVQAPHKALPQPNFVPVMPSTSRKTHSKGMSPSTSTSCSTPLTFILKGIDQSSRGLIAPFCRLRHDNGMRVMQCKANLRQFLNVCFGSLATLQRRIQDVCFTPDSGHSSVLVGRPKSDKSRHRVEGAVGGLVR